MSAHPKADILRQIEDEAEVNPEFWREFQWYGNFYAEWMNHDSFRDLMESIHENREVRRRPKTVRVSGEVSEELVEAAREVNQENSELAITLARALLSLVED